LLLGSLAVIWGMSYVLIAYALRDLGGSDLAWLRAILGVAVLVALRPRSLVAAVRYIRREPVMAVLMGACNVAIPFWLIAAGEHTVSSGVTAVLLATSPAIVALTASGFDASERLHWPQWLGVAVATTGVALIVGASPGQARSAVGVLAIMGAAGSYAAGSLLAKRRREEEPWLQAVVTLLVGSAFLTLPAVVGQTPGSPSASVWLALCALAVVGTAMSLVLLFTAVKVGGAGYSLVPLYLSPAVSIAGGALLLDDPVTDGLGIGFAVAIVGVVLTTRRATPSRRSALRDTA